MKIEVGHLHGGRATIFDTVPVTGTVAPYVPASGSKSPSTSTGTAGQPQGRGAARAPATAATFESSVVVREDGKYAVSAKHAATAVLGADDTVRKSWTVEFPAAAAGRMRDVVEGFKGALAKMGYVSGGGKCFNGRLGREVLAYRKVNGMDRSQKAGPGLVKSGLRRQGRLPRQVPGRRRTRRGPLDKQVMVLIKDGKPFAIYPVSTGKPSTPTITGHYSFYRQEPGFNSHGMDYSFYWHNGYAVHGYARSAELRRQPRLRAHLHRRPAADLRTAPLRREHLRLLRVRDSAHICVLGRWCAEHAALPASLICLVTHPQKA